MNQETTSSPSDVWFMDPELRIKFVEKAILVNVDGDTVNSKVLELRPKKNA